MGSRRSNRITVLRGGLATAGVVGALAGAHALRRLGSQVLWPAHRDEYRDEDFTLLERDRAGAVLTEDGVRLSTRECGPPDAPVTAIFVHGFCNSMESFHFQRRDLEKRWGERVRMVFFDLRGHGRSGTPSTQSCTVAQLGRDVAAVIESAAPTGPVLVIGHSLGGMAVLAAAAHAPELFAARVIGVGLLSTAAAEVTAAGVTQLLRNPAIDGFRLAVHTAPALVQAGRSSVRQVIAPILHVSSFHGPVSPTLSRFATLMIDRTPVETIVKFLKAIELHDESAALPILAELPVLVLGAGHDLVIPFRNSRALHRALPGSFLVRIDDAAHMPHMQYPEVVAEALDQLLVRALAHERFVPRRSDPEAAGS
ncbi:alpha/beta fold hydrolase [Nocardia bovistercoris]|uniref:Alpha/beta hydrolase n=1 Tax=Nocardia bovistercoris TaxID=2785916 RepID=A0A931IBM1_9NOCA|nr:alpha/beta hydrolase [Nocardia bovistercoris]MBH0777523.1 alpha/beta hydrolase [Nocardia bovistercoris]